MRRGLAAGLAATALMATGCTLNRPEDPVVMTGAQLPALQDVTAGDVVAFRWIADAWHQVPVQVDERKLVQFADIYGPDRPVYVIPGATTTVYADPDTFTGADGDAGVDSDDELALMAKDLGARRPDNAAAPPGVVAGSGVEVRVRSTLEETAREAWVYLFERSGALDPSAGQRYVEYDFRLLSGDYKTTYDVRSDATNPEESTLRTPFYATSFTGRWQNEELRITADDATGVDILDRAKVLLFPDSCSTNDLEMGREGGAFVANKSGPVRAIRSFLGASSGIVTQREHVFYERRQDIRTFLRVHQIGGVMDFLDYSRAATGMTYRNDNNTGGVTIDGNPDAVEPGELTWETVDGPQGALSMAHRVDTDIPDLVLGSYYLDDSTPDDPQCSGDAEAIGSSGPRVTSFIPNTDPMFPPNYNLTSTRTIYFGGPETADGPARAAQAGSPFEFTVSALP